MPHRNAVRISSRWAAVNPWSSHDCSTLGRVWPGAGEGVVLALSCVASAPDVLSRQASQKALRDFLMIRGDWVSVFVIRPQLNYSVQPRMDLTQLTSQPQREEHTGRRRCGRRPV